MFCWLGQRHRALIVAFGLFIVIAATFLFGLNSGYLRLSPADVFSVLTGGGNPQQRMILIHFRLPRMAVALLIGAGMAVSGAILQSITQNDLADPGILGINAGAGLAVVLFIFIFQGNTAALGRLAIFLMPFFALGGAAAAAAAIYLLARNRRGVTPVRLILSGVGINAGFSALITILQVQMNPQDFIQATIWLSGSIWGTDWPYVAAVAPWMFFFIPMAFFKAKTLSALELGDTAATGLGIPVARERGLFLLIAVALAGAAVSVGGGIAFLGLIVPHLVRRLAGRTRQALIPLSALMGAGLLLIADTVARTLWAPAEIPVGLVVSAIGAPYFLFLLFREKRLK